VFTSIITGESIKEIKRAFNSARLDAGIKNFTFHDLRHTFSTWAGECGVNEPVRRDLLGHSPNSITGSYTHSTLEARQNVVDAVGRYFEEQLQQYYSKAA
jgi:integrase